MKNKTFDCVEMKRQGARHIQEATAGMTLGQQVEYWRKRDADFRREQEDLIAGRKARDGISERDTDAGARARGGGAPGGGEDVIDAEFEEKR